MPELPEVENVRVSLIGLGSIGQSFERIELRREGLRVPFPSKLSARLRGQSVRGIHRRAKYLLIETDDFYLVSHLGMTGSWRQLETSDRLKHDHVILHFLSGFKLAFHDPRRFGVLDLVKKSELETNRWLQHLGVEPLSDDFNGEFIFSRTRKLKTSIKAFLMDQRKVVGVGNIYASEALFCAGIRPTRLAGRLTRAEADRLVECVRQILGRAISAGGSTIRDYRNSNGESGQFQAQFNVYDKAEEPCPKCGAAIQSKMITGRNTFWCPKCQR